MCYGECDALFVVLLQWKNTEMILQKYVYSVMNFFKKILFLEILSTLRETEMPT